MLVRYNTQTLARWTSATVTVAVLAKTFVPFYLIGSTAIFVATVAVGLVLVALSWRPIFDAAGRVPNALIVTALFYAMIVVSFLTYSHAAVPLTHLWGILIIHGIMLIFGFSAARALKMVLLVLFGAAAIYAALLALHAQRFGGVTKGINIDDIFGIGVPAIYITFHQNIGLVIGLGALAALGLVSNCIKQVFALFVAPVVMLLLFHIAARGALVSFAVSLVFWGLAACWVRSKRIAILSTTAIVIVATTISIVFYQRATHDHDINPAGLDAISRTIRELQDPNPGFRLPIWTRTLHAIVNEPDSLLFGRGIGMFPVNDGFVPDWLLHPTEGSKHYPHNVHMEILYETGIAGLLLFSILTALPIITSLRRWSAFSSAEKSAVAIYVFTLATSEISGGFAYAYILQFFLALTVGVIALKNTSKIENPALDG
jgi:O-antigen ligase